MSEFNEIDFSKFYKPIDPKLYTLAESRQMASKIASLENDKAVLEKKLEEAHKLQDALAQTSQNNFILRERVEELEENLKHEESNREQLYIKYCSQRDYSDEFEKILKEAHEENKLLKSAMPNHVSYSRKLESKLSLAIEALELIKNYDCDGFVENFAFCRGYASNALKQLSEQ